MRYYRDLQPGETLQAGDEKRRWPLGWAPVHPAYYGATPSATFLLDYRRPVDLPTLQRVTPEAMAELEGRSATGVLVATDQLARVLNYSHQGYWWRDDMGAGFRVNRPTRGYFIELAKLKEVQQ